MRRAMMVLSFILLLATFATAQTQVNSATQVNWTSVTGTSAPTQYCPTSTTGSTAVSSTAVTVASTTGILTNQTVVGSGIPTATQVVAVNAVTKIVTLSIAATATASSVSLTFSSLGMPYVNSTTGAQYVCSASGWVQPAGTVYPGVTSNGSNGINVAGTVAAGSSSGTTSTISLNGTTGTVAAGTTCPSGQAAGTVCGSNIFDVSTYGAVGDGNQNSTASVPVGSTTVTISAPPYFDPSVPGKTIVLPVDSTAVLYYTGSGSPSYVTAGMETTIASYISPTQVTYATGGLTSVVAISGATFSGTGTLFLTNFGGCTGSTATVNITSGAYTSATVTAAGNCPTVVPATATCTSGTATCAGSPASITVVANAIVPAQVACTGSCAIAWGTNNTTPVNSAFSALVANPNGGTLYYPKGNFLQDPVVFALNGTDFEMMGNGTLILGTQSKIANVQTILINNLTGPHGVKLHDFTLDFAIPLNISNGTDFQNSHRYAPYADAIRIGDNCNAPTRPSYCTGSAPGPMNDVDVNNVKVYNARMTGIAVNYGYGVNINNNRVSYVGQGITSANGVGNTIIHGNTVKWSSDDLIGVYNNEYLFNPTAITSTAVISGNVLSYGYAKAVGVGGIGHAVITGNSAEQTWAACYLVEDQAVFNETPSTDVQITNNSCDGAGTLYGTGQFHATSATDGDSGIYFYGAYTTLNNMVVDGNVITGYHRHGIEMTVGLGMGVNHATVANNYINGTSTCPACISGPIPSIGNGIVIGDATNTTATSIYDLSFHDNQVYNAAQSGIQLNSINGGKAYQNWIHTYNVNNGGQQTAGLSINYSNSFDMSNNYIINDNSNSNGAGRYGYALFHTNTGMTQFHNYYSTAIAQAPTDFSASTQFQTQQVGAQPLLQGELGMLVDSAASPGQGIMIMSPTNLHGDIMSSTSVGTGAYLVVTSGWTASSGTVTFTQTSGPTLAANTIIIPNTLAGCSSASGVSPLNNIPLVVLSGATSSSFQVTTPFLTGSGSGTCNFSIIGDGVRVDAGIGGGCYPGFLELAPLSTDTACATHPIEFGAHTWNADQAGNFNLNSLHIASCSGLLKSDGTCANYSPGGAVQIGQVIVSGTTTSTITFTVPSGYTNLRLVMYGAGSDSNYNAPIFIQFNGDTTAADYVGTYQQAAGATPSAGVFTPSANGIAGGVVAGASAAGGSYSATTSTLLIPSYLSTAFTTKAATFTTSYPGSTALIIQTAAISWKQSVGTAITSILLTDTNGHMMPGFTATLYAEP